MADAVRRAWTAGDDSALRDLAQNEEVDPFLVIDVLLLREARLRLGEGVADGRPIEAAQAYAGALPQLERSAPLLALIEAWAGLEHDALARGIRLAEARDRMIGARVRSAWPEMTEMVTTVAADLAGGLDTVALVEVHREAARAYANTGRPQLAIRHGRVAAEVAERLGWHERGAALWHQTARFASRHGEYDTARDAATRALAAHARSGSQRPRPVMRHDLAIATYRAGDLREAIPLAEAARREALAAGDGHTAARVLNTLVNIHQALGEVDRSIELAVRAIEEAKALGDRDAWLKTMVNLAGAYVRKDRYAEAIAACEEVLASPEAARDARLYAAAAGNLAGTLLKLGKVDEAIRHLESAREGARVAGLDALAVDLEAALATALIETERVSQAPAVLERILAYYTRTGNRHEAARLLASLAASYTLLGRDAEAAKKQAEALSAFQALGDRLGTARTHANLAVAHESRRRWKKAFRGHRRAIAEYRSLGLRVEAMALSLLGCGRVHVKAGSPEAALPYLDEATEIYFELLHGLGDEDALGLASRVRPVSDWGVAVADHVTRREPQRSFEAAAIAYRHLESARAILLGEALANAQPLSAADLPADLLRAEGDTRAAVDTARRRLLALATAGGDAAGLAAAKGALDVAWRERKACVARVQRSARRRALLAYPEVVPLEVLQRGLDGDTVVVLYRFLKYGFALVVSREDAVLVRLSESEAIRSSVRAYLRVLSAPELRDDRLAADLHARLIAPIQERIGGAKRLVISPDGVLAYLPFGALLDATGESPVRLIERHSISLVPSATVLVALQGDSAAGRGDHVLAVGDPVYGTEAEGLSRRGLARLPHSGAEAADVASLFPAERRTLLLREEATVAAVVGALGAEGRRFGAVHLACHAVVDAERPRRSALVLSGGEMLDVDAILALRIPSDFVVLSACETARGKLAGGEGVMGFVRAFFHAGVPRVVVSSWPISDASTRPLMRAFYEGIVEGSLPPAEALRQAQVQCLTEGGARSHPHHWAAFNQWGLDP